MKLAFSIFFLLFFHLTFSQSRIDTISISWHNSLAKYGTVYKLSIFKYKDSYNLVKEIVEYSRSLWEVEAEKERAAKLATIKVKREELNDTSYMSDEFNLLISNERAYEVRVKKSSYLLDSNSCFILMKEILAINKDSVGKSNPNYNYHVCDGESYTFEYWINGVKQTIYGRSIDLEPELRGYKELNNIYQKMLKWSKIYKNNKVDY